MLLYHEPQNLDKITIVTQYPYKKKPGYVVMQRIRVSSTTCCSFDEKIDSVIIFP